MKIWIQFINQTLTRQYMKGESGEWPYASDSADPCYEITYVYFLYSNI